MKARNRIVSLGLALCLLLGMVVYLPGPMEVYALPTSMAGAPHDGIDFNDLIDNGIYYGTYDHIGPTNGTVMPILWQVMGEENNNGNLTLLSEYVLSAHVFNSSYYGGNAQNYVDSELSTWLNGTFVSSVFAQAETNGIVSVDVVTGMYNRSGGTLITGDHYPQYTACR